MKQLFEAERIGAHCYWVGAIDWRLREFHGYETRRGSTYNAYLIEAQGGYILVDTVKEAFTGELLARISSVCDPREVRVVISNHSEMDHTGALREVLGHLAPDCKVMASRNGAKALAMHQLLDREVEVVKDGARVSVLGVELLFLETPMIHWPDSMFTYFVQDKILFSNDAFGMHLASTERWNDEYCAATCLEEARRYYANIITPYSGVVDKFLAKFLSLSLELEVVAPDHGLCWRGEGIAQILSHYQCWADPQKRRQHKLVVLFDTMWHSTQLMAEHIAQGARSQGVRCVVLPLQEVNRTQVAYELLEAGALALGSPTLNGGMLPTVADALCYAQGLKFTPLCGFAFGSYGWAQGALKALSEVLNSMGAKSLPSVSCQYIPSDATLEQCRDTGAKIAVTLKEEISL